MCLYIKQFKSQIYTYMWGYSYLLHTVHDENIRILGISQQAVVKYIQSFVANTSPTGKGLACMTEWTEMYTLQKVTQVIITMYCML